MQFTFKSLSRPLYESAFSHLHFYHSSSSNWRKSFSSFFCLVRLHLSDAHFSSRLWLEWREKPKFPKSFSLVGICLSRRFRPKCNYSYWEYLLKAPDWVMSWPFGSTSSDFIVINRETGPTSALNFRKSSLSSAQKAFPWLKTSN